MLKIQQPVVLDAKYDDAMYERDAAKEEKKNT